MRLARFFTVLAFAAPFTAGCTALVDGTLSGRGGMDAGGGTDTNVPTPDTGVPSACASASDGSQCQISASILEPFLCLHGACVQSRCGDGIVDPRATTLHPMEICDDGNDVVGDGCDNDCTYSCTSAADCTSTDECTTYTCSAAHACEAANAPDTTACTLSGGMAGECRGGTCVLGGCGDGTVTPPEQCEDGNTTPGDGCENDCTWTCEANGDCDDGNACNGVETCATHVCVEGSPMLCGDTDSNPCTVESCDAASGTCVTDTSANDVDGDGHYALSCGGDDCNDNDGAVHPGASEICNGGIDDDCDPATVEGAPTTYYADCDRDTYAADGAETTSSCGTPTAPPACGGAWASRTGDCDDNEPLANPGQTGWFTVGHGSSSSFDYNCDGSATPRYRSVTTTPTCTGSLTSRICNPGAFTYYAGTRIACGRSVGEYTCPSVAPCTLGMATVTAECH